jgi:quinol monooxygenase YgiN
MIQAVYILKTEKKSAKNLIDLLNIVSSRVIYSPGCLQSDIWSSKDRNKFIVYEMWRSRIDLENHIHSQLYHHLLTALEMCNEKPVIKFAECENVQGIEMIEKVLLNDHSMIG